MIIAGVVLFTTPWLGSLRSLGSLRQRRAFARAKIGEETDERF